VLRTLGASLVNYANKIWHFFELPASQKMALGSTWEANCDGKKLLWVALARAELRDPSLVRYGMPDCHAQRRAGLFRQRAQQLTEAASAKWTSPP
jgi:hypothetical protein